MTRGRQRTDRDERRRRHVLQEGTVWCGIAARSEQALPITTAAGCNAACCTLSVPCCTLIMLHAYIVAMLQGCSMLHTVCSMLHVRVVYYKLYYVARCTLQSCKLLLSCATWPTAQARSATWRCNRCVATVALRCVALRCGASFAESVFGDTGERPTHWRTREYHEYPYEYPTLNGRTRR